MEKPAPTDLPIHDLIRRRWSPRSFSPRPVPPVALTTIFEAARWAPSCFNEQPWAFIVCTIEDPAAHERAESVLVEGNAWARSAPVLALSLARPDFSRNGKPNPHAWHDVGAAAENLFLEAVHQGLAMHEMAGFDRVKAREAFAVPEGWEPVAMIAIGYPGSPDDLPEPLREREKGPRTRKPLAEIVFGGRFGAALGG